MRMTMYPNKLSSVELCNAKSQYCEYFGYDDFRNNIGELKKKINRKVERPQRTSTPVSDYETSTSGGFSDSVNEFFYQTWKNELHSEEGRKIQQKHHQIPNCNGAYQNYANCCHQQVLCLNHMVPMNTIHCYYTPFYGSVVYCPAVGYRHDGTYGVLDNAWYCFYR